MTVIRVKYFCLSGAPFDAYHLWTRRSFTTAGRFLGFPVWQRPIPTAVYGSVERRIVRQGIWTTYGWNVPSRPWFRVLEHG